MIYNPVPPVANEANEFVAGGLLLISGAGIMY
jgi:hypothetical protein